MPITHKLHRSGKGRSAATFCGYRVTLAEHAGDQVILGIAPKSGRRYRCIRQGVDAIVTCERCLHAITRDPVRRWRKRRLVQRDEAVRK